MSYEALACAVLVQAVKDQEQAASEGFWSVSNPQFVLWCEAVNLDPAVFLRRLYARRHDVLITRRAAS